MQKVLTLSTLGGSVRSPVDGWSADDSDLVVGGKPIGLMGMDI